MPERFVQEEEGRVVAASGRGRGADAESKDEDEDEDEDEEALAVKRVEGMPWMMQPLSIGSGRDGRACR